MGNLSGAPIIGQGLYESSATKQHALGTLHVTGDGRKFRYVQAGGTALVVGNLLQEAAEDTAYRSMVVQAAAAVGATEISVTLGGTAVTANQFDEGHLLVESAAGIGQLFKINSHTVQTSTTGTCTFTVDRGVETALTTSSQVSVRKNPYDGVIVYPATTATGQPVGVATFIIVASEYGWVQSGGPGTALFDDGTNTSNGVTAIVPSASVAGSVKPEGETDPGGSQVGFAREIASVDSTQGFVWLTID